MKGDNMRLEIGNFYVKDVRFGEETSYRDGILSIDKEAALAFIKRRGEPYNRCGSRYRKTGR